MMSGDALKVQEGTPRAAEREGAAATPPPPPPTPPEVGGGERWTLRVDVGREAGTSMPADWAKSGARLPFSLEVDVLPTKATSEAEPKVGAGAYRLEPCTPVVSITGFSGAVQIPVRGGGWRVADGKLAFWLDFPEGSTRGDASGDTSNVWGLAPGVATQAMDVTIPAGRLLFEGLIWTDEELEQLNKEYLAARSVAWRAKEAVRKMEQAKSPVPKWSNEKQAWVSEGVDDGPVAAALKRAEASRAAMQQAQMDGRRPKRKELARDAGPWPCLGGAVWIAKKGKVSLKQKGPLGLGSRYSELGSWSVEPKEPVETFWTMPEG